MRKCLSSIVLLGFLIIIFNLTILKDIKAMITEKEWEKEPMAILSCFGYGYKAEVKINGADTGIKGGQSEEKRLFYKTSALAKKAPDFIKKNFILNKGENQIQVEFTKVEKKY